MKLFDREMMLRAVSPEQVMDEIEGALAVFEAGAYTMPHRISVVEGEDTLLYMPCFSGDWFGTKALTLFPGNQAKGHPYIHGVYLLHERDSGRVAAVLEGSFLTALRTGAVGGMAMRRFSLPDSSSVGIVGCGTQGYYQALFACKARPIRDIWLYDPFASDLNTFAQRLGAEVGEGIAIHCCQGVEELLESSDIVVTATTSTTPVLPEDAGLLRNKLFVAIGSYKPHMRELPGAIWQAAQHIITELPYACEESGDLSQPIAQGLLDPAAVQYAGSVLAGGQMPQPGQGKSVIYKSVGMGLFDLMCARLIYEQSQ